MATQAYRLGEKLRREGHRYSKAGVVTTDLAPLALSQRAMPGLG